MKLFKKLIRLLGLGAWPQTNQLNVELKVHPRRGADLRVGSKDFPQVAVTENRVKFMRDIQKYGRALRKVK